MRTRPIPRRRTPVGPRRPGPRARSVGTTLRWMTVHLENSNRKVRKTKKKFEQKTGFSEIWKNSEKSARVKRAKTRMMTRATLGRRTERRRGVGGRGVEDPLLLFFLSIETVLRRTQIATTFTWLTTQTKKAITIKVICILWSFVVNHVNDITQLKV